MIECGLCDETFEHWQELAMHVADEHVARFRKGNGKRLPRLNREGDAIACWCGAWFSIGSQAHVAPAFKAFAALNVAESQFARHLRKQGGLAVHVLSITFGTARRG